MKCPKCGYNSFEYYDSCKKCSSDLTGFKQTHSIVSLVLPLEAKEQLASSAARIENDNDLTVDNFETHDDIFSFDLPDDAPATAHNDDPFNFDEPATELNHSTEAKKEEDLFADLLESTSQSDESPFGTSPAAAAPPSSTAASKTPDFSAGPGEFDLENFSWDDTPVATAASGTAGTDDDFDSLFGDAKESGSK